MQISLMVRCLILLLPLGVSKVFHMYAKIGFKVACPFIDPFIHSKKCPKKDMDFHPIQKHAITAVMLYRALDMREYVVIIGIIFVNFA